MGCCRRSDWCRLLTLLSIRVLDSRGRIGNASLNKCKGVLPLAAAVAPGSSLTAAPVGLLDDFLRITDLRRTTDPSSTTVGISIRLRLPLLHTRLRIKATMGMLVAIRVILEANKPELSFKHRRTHISRNEAAMPCMSLHPALRLRSKKTGLFDTLEPKVGLLGYEARILPGKKVQLQSIRTHAISFRPLFFPNAVLILSSPMSMLLLYLIDMKISFPDQANRVPLLV